MCWVLLITTVIFLFDKVSFFSPAHPFPNSELLGKYSCFLTDDLVNIQMKIPQIVYIPGWFCPIILNINIHQDIFKQFQLWKYQWFLICISIRSYVLCFITLHCIHIVLIRDWVLKIEKTKHCWFSCSIDLQSKSQKNPIYFWGLCGSFLVLAWVHMCVHCVGAQIHFILSLIIAFCFSCVHRYVPP